MNAREIELVIAVVIGIIGLGMICTGNPVAAAGGVFLVVWGNNMTNAD